jgi:HEAT repeat protein
MIGDTRAVEPLIKVLKDGKYEGRYYVGYCGAEALGKIGTPAVEPLIALLRAENAVVCMFAAKALGLIGDARAVELLIAALKVDDKNLRRFAAEALGTIGDPRALLALIEMLKDLDKDLRQTAAFALGNIGDARAVEPLIAALKAEDKNERRAVVVALIQLYKVEQLDEVNKKLIFAHRSEITAPHWDVSDNCPGGGYHASHIDVASVDFPL